MRLNATIESGTLEKAGTNIRLGDLTAIVTLEGVECVFGYPGGALLYIYDAMHGNPDFHHLLTRHEQGAIHAADGYARATGRTGVCLATSGPGATNLVTGIATAYMDSVPLVVITGNVATSLIGTDAFQEADIIGITQPDYEAQLLRPKRRRAGRCAQGSILPRRHRKEGTCSR